MILSAALWFRDDFPTFFATFWLYIILWGVVGGAFSVLLYMDGHFSKGLAEGASINPVAFQVMGWCFRFFAAVFLMAAARYAYQGVKGGVTFKVMGVFVSILVAAHAIGIGLEAMSDKRDSALVERDVAQVQVVGVETRAGLLNQQKADIRADLARQVDPIREKILIIQTDGDPRNDTQDVLLERRIQELEDAATERIRQIDDALLALTEDTVSARTDVVEAERVQAWAPLFVGIAEVATWSKAPSEWAIYLSAVGFIVFWVLIAEALVIFLPPAIYQMHLADAAKAKAERATEAEAPPPMPAPPPIELPVAPTPAPASEPPDLVKEPVLEKVAPDPEPEPLTPQQVAGSKGGRANGHYSRAKRADNRIPVDDVRWSEESVI